MDRPVQRIALCVAVPAAAVLAAAGLAWASVHALQIRPHFGEDALAFATGPLARTTVAAETLHTVTQLIVQLLAFAAIGCAAIIVAAQAAARIAPQTAGWWVFAMALFAAAGAGLVMIDPIGPLVGCDVRPDLSCGAGDADASAVFRAAMEEGIVPPAAARLASGLILAAGALAGAVMAAILLYLAAVARPSAEIATLARRRAGFLRIVALSAIALSIGVTMIDTFLSWPVAFLTEPAHAVAKRFASAGTQFWGALFAVVSVVSAGIAAAALDRDIAAATPAGEAGEGWRKDKGLDFDPLRAAAAVVAALGPVLTSSILTLLPGAT